jgi:hypothetical protein
MTGFIFFASVIACDTADNRLKIVNKSHSNIYIFFACDSLLTHFKLFRNGYYKSKAGDSAYVMSSEFVKRDTSVNIPMFGRDAWKVYVDDCPNSLLNLYFIDDTIAHKYTDTEISSLKLFRRHIALTYSELEERCWTVVIE